MNKTLRVFLLASSLWGAASHANLPIEDVERSGESIRDRVEFLNSNYEGLNVEPVSWEPAALDAVLQDLIDLEDSLQDGLSAQPMSHTQPLLLLTCSRVQCTGK